MRKAFVILVLSVLTITTIVMMAVPQAKAAAVTIYDHPTDPVQKDTTQLGRYWTYADQGILAPQYTDPDLAKPSNIWLRGIWGLPHGSTTVNSGISCSEIYIQYHASDDNDGVTDIYVDDMVNPIARIDTYMRGDWYVEISGLLYTPHTVKVHASENNNMAGVTPSPHRALPTVANQDNDVWYFGFGGIRVGGIAIPVDKLGLLAPYVGLSSTIIVAIVATAITIKRVNRRKEK